MVTTLTEITPEHIKFWRATTWLRNQVECPYEKPPSLRIFASQTTEYAMNLLLANSDCPLPEASECLVDWIESGDFCN